MNTLSFRPDDDFFQRKYQRPRKFTPPDSNCSPKFGPFRRTLVWYSEPSGGGASGNNMVRITSRVYDGGAAGGDGNVTSQTQYVDASTTRVTTFGYDFRSR